LHLNNEKPQFGAPVGFKTGINTLIPNNSEAVDTSIPQLKEKLLDGEGSYAKNYIQTILKGRGSYIIFDDNHNSEPTNSNNLKTINEHRFEFKDGLINEFIIKYKDKSAINHIGEIAYKHKVQVINKYKSSFKHVKKLNVIKHDKV